MEHGVLGEKSGGGNDTFKMHGVINQNGDVDLNDIIDPGSYLIDGNTNHRKPKHWPFNPIWGHWGLLNVYYVSGTRIQEIKTWDGFVAYRWNDLDWNELQHNNIGQGYMW